jgi:hypothetical protein
MTDTSLHEKPAMVPARTFGKLARNVVGYAVLTAVMFVSPLFVFLPAALFHCGLRHGRRITWLVLAIGAAIAVLIAVPAAQVPQVTAAEANMSFAYLAALILGVALPALAVLPMVERGEGFGRVLLAALLFSIIGLAMTEASMRSAMGFSPYADQVAGARVTASKFVTAYERAGMPPDAVGFLRHWMEIGVYCLPAFLLIDVALVFVLSLVLLGRLRAWRDIVERRQRAATPYLFRNLSLPEWLLFAFVVGGLSPLASGMAQRIGANVLAVVVFLYLLQGLAIFRSLLAAAGAGFAGVTFAYVLLALLTMSGIAPLLLSIAGLFDSFFDFRKFNRKDHPDEDHSD